MKRFIILLLIACGLSVSTQSLFAYNLSEAEQQQANQKLNKYIKYVYDKIKFPRQGKLNYDAFKSGFYGYLNLLEQGKIVEGALLSICDFTLSSNVRRMWVIDVKNKKLLFHTLVAHGQGTGEEFATRFSNIHESHQSSLGFYITAETYIGNNGYSLKLHGVDGIYNNNAYDRAIVIHGADYVSEEFAKANQRLGRSHGCPALPVDIAPRVIDKIKNGHCLFIYHTAQNYLKNSYWLTSKIRSLPKEADLMDLNFKTTNPRYVEVDEPSDASAKQKSYSEQHVSSQASVGTGSDSDLSIHSKKATVPELERSSYKESATPKQDKTSLSSEPTQKISLTDKRVSSIIIINEATKDTIRVK